MYSKYHILLLLILLPFFSKSQFVIKKKEVPDSAFTIPFITFSYAFQWTGADLQDRFGTNSNVGGTIAVKTKKKWLFGIKGNFIWGGKVNEPDILAEIKTDDGSIIDNSGFLTDIHYGERGSSFFLIGGKILNKFAINKNSGIMLYGGVGTLQHKISIKFDGEIVSLTDEHKKGYDRFSFGYAVNGFIGYLFLSKNRLVNFFGGFDYTHGWTKNQRRFNYDTGLPDLETRTDILYGIRAGWIIRLNKRSEQEFYYN